MPTGGTNTGSGANDVGDFDVLLLQIPDIESPDCFEQRITLPGSGRLAFRFRFPPASRAMFRSIPYVFAILFIAIAALPVAAQVDFVSDSCSVGVEPYHLAAGDFNEDGFQDIAVPIHGPQKQVAILLNDGAGGFCTMSPGLAGTGGLGIATGDFDGDGHLDLVSSIHSSSGILLHFGVGDGTFVNETPISTGFGPAGLAAADFDEDGDLDIGVAVNQSNLIQIFHNDGFGAFTQDRFQPDE